MREFFLAKIGALLHDPPDKAWLLMRMESHERRARELSRKILSDDLYDQVARREIEKVVDDSDAFAASFDRWLISEAGFERGRFRNRTVCLLNILSGDCYCPPKEPEIVDIEGFASELGELLSKIGDNLTLKYHVLYGLLEPLFYEHCPEIASPADTRFPTHSIFDHIYATALAVNWMFKSTAAMPSGLLIRIDLGGVQRFISSSRKLSDFWVSSWLTSFIAWKTIEKIVDRVGPDVLIKPTSRNNAFYYHLLLSKLKDANIDVDVYKRVKNIAERYANYDKEFGMPRHPIIPATIDLVVPPLDVLSSFLQEKIDSTRALADHFFNAYLAVWRQLIEKIEEAANSDEGLKTLLDGAFKKLREQGIDAQPPLLLRVITVLIPDEIMERIKDEEEVSRYKVYDEAFNSLSDKMFQIGMFKTSPFVATELTSQTEGAWKDGSSYAICSVCGELPSVLEIEYQDDPYQKQVPENLKIYFDQGEKLCGYCLIKRLMSIYNIFEVVARDIVQSLERPKAVSFPSTGDIASIKFKQRILDTANVASPRKLSELCQLIRSYLERPLLPATLTYRKLAKLIEEAEDPSILKDEDVRLTLARFLRLQSETLYLRSERIAERREQDKVRKEIQKIIKQVLGDEALIGAYYTILRADTDSLGKLLSGSIDEALFPVPSCLPKLQGYIEVLRRAFEDERIIENPKLRELYSRAIKGDEAGVVEILTSEGVPEANRRAPALIKLFDMIRGGRLLVSPTYHATLTRSLMITAVKDIECVERMGGVVIYAGGDDLLAFLPVETTLETIVETRRYFSDGDFRKGFYKLGGGVFPCAGLASRSYAAIFAHYIYPMSALLTDSYESLERVAKETVRSEPKPQLKKDVAAIKFVPRGGGAKVKGVIPLRKMNGSGYGSLIECSKDIISKINEGIFSMSLSYDLAREFIGNEGERRMRIYLKNPDVLRSIITSIVSRNVVTKLDEKAKEREIKALATRLYESSRILIKYPSEEGEKEALGIQSVISTILAYYSAIKGRE
jgi:CRISPR-associated protein Cmr2